MGGVGDETGSARALSSARAPTVASKRAMMASTSSGEAGFYEVPEDARSFAR